MNSVGVPSGRSVGSGVDCARSHDTTADTRGSRWPNSLTTTPPRECPAMPSRSPSNSAANGSSPYSQSTTVDASSSVGPAG
jgi:hypothetical protein